MHVAHSSSGIHFCSLGGAHSKACGLSAHVGRHATSVPLQRGTEVLAFNPRYSKLMAVAEPVANVPSSSSRSGKERAPVPCYVSLVQLK